MNRFCTLKSTLSRSSLARWRLAALPGLVLCLAACGGGDAGNPQGPRQAAAQPGTARVLMASTEPVAPLIADDGSLMPAHPRSVPQDRGAHTRAGRYASAAQAAQLEQALGNDVLSVNIGCCGIEAADQAVAIAHGLQAAHNLPYSAPVFVRGADLRLAAAVANRLADGGHTQVWLVTP